MKRTLKLCLQVAVAMCLISAIAACSLMFSSKPALPERHGQVTSKLFLGEGNNQPLIVGLGGSEGGNPWASEHWKPQRDKFIAQGYAFLALGYFGDKNTPRQLDRIALEGVHKAVMDATKDPHINGKQIIIMGGSKGAELALTLASYYPEYTAVIAIVPGSAIFPALTLGMNTSSFSYHGQELTFVPVPWSATPALIKRDLRTAFEKMMENNQVMADAAIKVENIHGPILLLSATKDEMWPSMEMSEQMVQRLEKAGFSHKVQHTAIEGGHTEPLKHFSVIEDFLAANLTH
ncbi:dienelactone hydrolase [Cellvibrio zantedeschiae]|uniref:Dienelactone hydrolase n=1 Tax=Cellvibrio zantedeschiae TaxID=1237077 RepID=A0ABQ3AMW4_9GAMM|nr:acyl-CoA thioester hydrolase/BAAT C-terminal domain-containing protein [Cellvibrio zantedeschiae]GGY61575.1 dienelactone hydrolase [Cellvibrio zantedeschiae]